MTEGGNERLAVARNLRKSRKNWMRMTSILGREVADLWISFFKAFVQAVLIFRS